MRTWLSANDDRYSLYDESGQWLGEYDASGTPVQQIVWLGSLPVGVFTGSGAAQKLHYIEADALGTPRVVVDPARGTGGTAVWRWALTGEAFGNTAPDQDPDGDSVAFVFDMRFPGQRYDNVSRLNYNYFRDYDAVTGRYAESDPVGLVGGISTYSYVSSSPLLNVDPTGLEGYGPWTVPPPPTAEEAQCRSQKACANSAFFRNYSAMREANWKMSDKYFHCKANCEATRCGKCGYDQACLVSDSREWFDRYIKRDEDSASEEDQVANRYGRNGARANAGRSCQIVCSRFRPPGLPAQY